MYPTPLPALVLKGGGWGVGPCRSPWEAEAYLASPAVGSLGYGPFIVLVVWSPVTFW